MTGVAAKGGLILFVGTRDGQAASVVRAASLAGGYHLFDKWTPGTLTNGQQILGKCATKVVNEKDEDIPGFERQLSERAAIKPDLVICLNPLENYILLHECGLHNIPTIGIVDTDVNPTWVTYPIPANDDSLRSVSVIAGALGRAGEAGLMTRLQRARDGAIDYSPAQGLTMPTREEMQASKHSKDKLAIEDREEDEQDDMLTPEEEALYAVEETSVERPEQSALEDDMDHFTPESDETLMGFADLTEDKSTPSAFSEQELDLLAKSVQQDLSATQANTTGANESEAITYGEAVSSAVESAQPTAQEGDAVNITAQAGAVDRASASDIKTPEAAVSKASNASFPEFQDDLFPEANTPQTTTKPASRLTEEEEQALLAESVQFPTNDEITAYKEYQEGVAQEGANEDKANTSNEASTRGPTSDESSEPEESRGKKPGNV